MKMSIINALPANTYEGLKKQFFAMKVLLRGKEAEIETYRSMVNKFSIERVIRLEAELESEKAMNDILTKELESLQTHKG